jgi:hypothetical protein
MSSLVGGTGAFLIKHKDNEQTMQRKLHLKYQVDISFEEVLCYRILVAPTRNSYVLFIPWYFYIELLLLAHYCLHCWVLSQNTVTI